MAKGSGNIRGRSSDASKPYDVSNSFVKRVASRVTELLPQPTSWLSRWMSPSEVPNTSDFVGHSLSSTITSRPPATSRAELNIVDNVDHAPVAKKPRTNRYNSPVNQKFLKNDQYGAEDISPIAVRGGGEPVAGPSTRETRPELIASTPAMPQQMTAKVNGDDCSETSESTSGCSSLVPQAQSSTRSLGGSRYGRSIPGGSTLDALDRRRPSFNTTTFHSPLRASMRARMGSSPFYSGRTMYGGSSQAYNYARLVESSPSRQGTFVRRVEPTMRPVPSQQSSLPLSSTAKRILDALEHFSTPMIDAKKMPVVGTKRKLESLIRAPQQRYTELNIPSTPDLLRVKRRERLQQSTLDARQTAAQTTPVPAAPVPEYTIRNEDTDRKKHTGKVKTKNTLEKEETVTELNLPAAVLEVRNLPKIDIAIPPPPKPVAVSSQPLTTAGSKFVFSQPTIVTSVVVPVHVPTSTFMFSEPLADNSSNKHVPSSETQKSKIPSDELSSNLTKQEGDSKKNALIDTGMASAMKSTFAGSGTSTNASPINTKYKVVVADDKTVSTTQKWVCSNCKNNNSSSLEICTSCKTNKSSKTLSSSKNNIKSSTPSGFDNWLKKPLGSWECSTCLILNKGEASKCVACESSKPVAKEKSVEKVATGTDKLSTVQANSEPKVVSSGFGNLFKKPSGVWTCDVCMINNDADKVKCAACETPKPGASAPKVSETSSSEAKQTGSGFGNLFKKPSGTWTCDVCMINNDADKVKCAACETPKPGATIPTATETSGPKFSFGIPSAVSASTKVEPTFNFGIPKGDQTSSNLNSSSFMLKTTTSSESAQTPAPTFSFGIPKTEDGSLNSVTSSTISSKPTFQFGSGSVLAKAQETNSSSAETPTNLFGNLSKNSTPEAKKPAESEKPTFSIPTTLSTSVSIKPATPVFGVNTEKSTSEETKTANTPNLFAFGTGKAVQNEVKTSDSSSTPKPAQAAFMFGAKQEGYGSNLPSSTTNTLSSSSPSNVFKFGDTKTVSSGSGATSISSVSTQASVMTPTTNNMFSLNANSEKKTITFGTTQTKETATSVPTPTTEAKPTFGFGKPNMTSTFGSTNTFGSSRPTLVTNEQQATPFATQTTNSTFGTTTANTSSSTFPSFGQTNAFQNAQQDTKPSPVFTFGSSAPQNESAPSGGFVFNPVFPSNQTQHDTQSQPLFGFNNTPASNPAPSPAFNFQPKFGSAASGGSLFNASGSTPAPVFGATLAQQVQSFGEQATTAPMFNFGSQSAQQPQAPANPVFEFGSNQQQNVAAPQPAPTFMFGAASAAPAAAPTNPPAFDPNMKPTFNFTQGTSTPVFSAIPTVNATGPPQPTNRKIRKAVRRTNISSVRN
ncbi:nuclear pore complex protein Nup153-like isoform X1 [Macrosteles quadrilineatus]|uniref:nuclear pore complex protein Nup153-like isoform X1 n=2 Tax=Macrosteles quadrilineatus TaxID=74068 RepID=UPI0023E2F93C|nr:nuclear pore complex protein Nup153-like isoform X1 [Macrosteles quadrilineatus]